LLGAERHCTYQKRDAMSIGATYYPVAYIEPCRFCFTNLIALRSLVLSLLSDLLCLKLNNLHPKLHAGS